MIRALAARASSSTSARSAESRCATSHRSSWVIATTSSTDSQNACTGLLSRPWLWTTEDAPPDGSDIWQLRWIADRLGLPYERLGLLPDRAADGQPPTDLSLNSAPGPVGDSQRAWCRVRRKLNQNRHMLSQFAAGLYPESLRGAESHVLTMQGWLPGAPLELGSIALSWQADASPPRLRGADAEARAIPVDTVVPLVDDGSRYDRYFKINTVGTSTCSRPWPNVSLTQPHRPWCTCQRAPCTASQPGS